MRRTALGGLDVSAQGLGCMGMSEYYGASDWDTSIATIRHAIDVGVTLFDTADQYGSGHNEVLVGRAIVGQRDDVQIATKFGIDRSGGDENRVHRGDPPYVKRSCDASLLRLGVDHIDLYYLHRPPDNAEIEDTVGAMAELVDAGKVRYLGLSEVGTDVLRRAHNVHPIAAVQSEYSLWTREVEDVTPVMAELGIGLVPYAPLGRGFLTGSVKAENLDPGDFRARNPRFTGDASQQNQVIADTVRATAERLGVLPAQVALAWVYAQADRLGVPVVPIPGTRHASRLDENIASLDVELDAATLAQLQPLSDQVQGGRYADHGVR
ncbi:aldo/keto reductase [Mycobacterium sp.]|uniref:aldo/keto reductase n=1 Tax=Mycobacterium sp. TaxID=1785 RepID=UPI0025D74350|nr:aldo/keto reductase [Mycobacterium sp.]